MSELRTLVARAEEAFEGFDYALPLHATEELFWQFCDDFLELVKVRSYSEEDTPERRSATATLHLGLETFIRLFRSVHALRDGRDLVLALCPRRRPLGLGAQGRLALGGGDRERGGSRAAGKLRRRQRAVTPDSGGEDSGSAKSALAGCCATGQWARRGPGGAGAGNR